jgi:hypothetical protein
MDARYAPPRRRRAAWHEGYDEDLQQAPRVAVAILDPLQVHLPPQRNVVRVGAWP